MFPSQKSVVSTDYLSCIACFNEAGMFPSQKYPRALWMLLDKVQLQ